MANKFLGGNLSLEQRIGIMKNAEADSKIAEREIHELIVQSDYRVKCEVALALQNYSAS